jgi:hypothetical protein
MRFYIAGKRHASGTIDGSITHLDGEVPLSRSTRGSARTGLRLCSVKPIEMER